MDAGVVFQKDGGIVGIVSVILRLLVLHFSCGPGRSMEWC